MRWFSHAVARVVFLILGYATNAFVLDALAEWHVRRGIYAEQQWKQLKVENTVRFVRDAHDWLSLNEPQAFAFQGSGLRVELAHAADEKRATHRALRLELGVPFRCVRIDWKQVEQPGLISLNLIRSHLLSVGIPAPQALVGLAYAGSPMSPWIWWGVLLNSVVYGLPLAGIWYTGKACVRRIRRLIRRRRRHCPNCGYDVQDVERCPECGLVAQSNITA